MEAKDVMAPNVITVTPDSPVQEIASLLVENRISAVPVVDAAGRLVGIVSEGDLMRRSETDTLPRASPWLSLLIRPDESARVYAKAHGQHARDVLTTDVITVDEHMPLTEVAAIFERKRNYIKRVPVMRGGTLVGIVSRANLLQGLVAQKPQPGASADDSEIRARALEALREAGLDGLRINPVVSGGVVQLWGAVNSEAERQAALVAAENVDGVAGVEDHLSVLSAMLRGAWPG
ncbi:MAG: histidine kinase [Burkholderiales bacterium]|nr:MAG: histidine kinase [Burkholderiales bacterium]